MASLSVLYDYADLCRRSAGPGVSEELLKKGYLDVMNFNIYEINVAMDFASRGRLTAKDGQFLFTPSMEIIMEISQVIQ